MKKLHITAIVFLIAAELLLGGCAGQVDNPTNTNSNLDISSNSFTQSEILPDDTSSAGDSKSLTGNTENSNDSEAGSISDDSHLEIPIEFTDEDRELQKILSDLVGGANEIYMWYRCALGGNSSPMVNLIFPESDYPEMVWGFYPISDNYKLNENSLLVVPTTRADMEKMCHKFYSEEVTKKRIDYIQIGKMTENPDGTFTVSGVNLPSKFIELDGRLYCHSDEGAGSLGIIVETAKVKSKTDDTIIFTYCYDDYTRPPDYSWFYEGLLKFESDGWKLDDWNLPNS